MTARPDAPEHTAAVDRSGASDADFQQMLATIEATPAAEESWTGETLAVDHEGRPWTEARARRAAGL